MLQMLFSVSDDGDAVPLSPRGPGGAAREPNGTTVLSIEQAHRITGHSPARLRNLWLATWADLIDGADAELLESGDDKVLGGAASPADSDDGLSEIRPLNSQSVIAQTRGDVLRTLKYPDLSDEEFALAEDFCRQKGLNLWSRHIWVKRLFDESAKRMRMEFVLCIDALRLIAHRTGQYAGCDATVFEYSGDDPRRPSRATQTVYRIVSGVRQSFTRSVYWDEYAPLANNAEAMSEMMPHDFLGRCAEAAALRRAFPEELSGLYCPEEIKRAERRGDEAIDREKAGEVIVEPAPSGHAAIDDCTPQTQRQFELALIDLGFGKPVQRQQIIQRFRAMYGQGINAVQFYADVLKAIRENPAFYGAQVESTVAA